MTDAPIAPRLDIVVPTRNRSGQLRLALESALAQVRPGVTIHVLDNRSDDDTETVVRALLDAPHGYRRNEADLGMVGNWNRALVTGDAPLVQILHDDDELAPGFVDEMLALFDERPDLAFAHCAAHLIDAEGRITGENRCDLPRVMSGDAFLEGWLDGRAMVTCPTAVMNRAVLPTGTRFDPNLPFTADLLHFLAISAHGPVGYLSEPRFRYRQHAASTTSALAARIHEKIADRRHAAGLLQGEVDRRLADRPGAADAGRDYRRRAMAADVLFARLTGGGLGDAARVGAAVLRAEPALLGDPRMWRAAAGATLSGRSLRKLGALRRRLRRS